MNKTPSVPAQDASVTALTEATPDEPPPPFVAVEISPRTSSLPGDEVVDGARRGRRWKGVWRWGGKTKKAAPGSSSSLSPAPASVIWPILRFIFFLAMLIGSAVGYAVSLSRFNASAKTTPDPTKPDQDDEMASTPLFLHACFGMALLLELVGCWRTFRTLVRIRLYKRPSVDGWLPPEEITAAEATTGAPTGASGSLPPTPRFVRALFGAAPKQSPPPTLPTYQSALQQSARQAARREAQAIGWTAGRRGREQIGTGDAEDLELERIRRLGALPPAYRSSTMRDNKVVMRGEAGTRRTWRLSHLSEVFSQRSSRASLEAAVDTPPSAVSAFFRRLSLLVNAIPSPAASSSEAEAPVVPEKTITSPPRSPGPSSPLRQSHLRQRSNGSLNASSATRDGSLSPRRTLTSVKEAVV